jgi:hypothetical protein
VALGCAPVAGYTTSVEVLGRLVDRFPQIVALNIVETPFGYVNDCRTQLPSRVDIYVGQTGAVQGFALGAKGVLSAAANVVPQPCAQVASGTERVVIPVSSAEGTCLELPRRTAVAGLPATPTNSNRAMN